MAKEAGKLLLRDGRSGPQNGVPEGVVLVGLASPRGLTVQCFPQESTSPLPRPFTLDVSDHTRVVGWVARKRIVNPQHGPCQVLSSLPWVVCFLSLSFPFASNCTKHPSVVRPSCNSCNPHPTRSLSAAGTSSAGWRCGTTLPAHLSRVPVAPPLTCDATSLTASPPHLRPRTTIYRSLCLLPRLSQKGSGLRLQTEAALTAPPMRSNLPDDVSAAAWAPSKVATPPLLSEQCHSSTGCSGSGVAPARGARRRHCL